jgi:hypothetical protein
MDHDSLGEVNFQEYAFGVLFKDGYFYVAGGGAVKRGGRSYFLERNLLNEEKVGGVLKIKESDGSMTMINGGLRACNGIAWGPDSSIWLTDNQGSFRPGSQLIAMAEGANYGYPNKVNAFSSKPVTPPSLWLVQSEIARSPTYPHWVEKGIYAGQFLMGDISLGGIKRAFVEKVEGAWQGAAFSFTGGLEVGIQSIVEDNKGVLYVGGMGRNEHNNWGWNFTKFGLQKLTPKANSITFEILAIRSRRNGMELEFTKPVGAGADNPANYSVAAAQMLPDTAYGGGNMVGKANLAIQAVTVSLDRRKVFLELNGLTAKRVLVIKALGVKSETGETPRCPAGWYTLNAISPTEAFTSPTGLVQKNPALADAGAIHIRISPEGLRVKVPFDGGHSAVLRTLQGRQVAEQSATGAHEYAFPQALHSGLYVLQVRASGRIFTKTVAI